MSLVVAFTVLCALTVMLGCSTLPGSNDSGEAREPTAFDEPSGPSAVSVAARKQDLEKRIKEIDSRVNSLRRTSYCRGLMEPLAEREKVLQDAQFLAIAMDAQTASYSETYKVQQAMWEHYDEVEDAIDKCNERERESASATREAFLPTQQAQLEALSTIDAQQLLEQTRAEEEAYRRGDQALAYALERDNLPPDYGSSVCDLMRQADFSMTKMGDIWNDGWWDDSWNAPNDDGMTQLSGNALILTLNLNLGQEFEGWCDSRFP